MPCPTRCFMLPYAASAMILLAAMSTSAAVLFGVNILADSAWAFLTRCQTLIFSSWREELRPTSAVDQRPLFQMKRKVEVRTDGANGFCEGIKKERQMSEEYPRKCAPTSMRIMVSSFRILFPVTKPP